MARNRFLVINESMRRSGCEPGPPTQVVSRDRDLAAAVGAALGLPWAAETTALEHCSVDDFVLYAGSWDCFAQVTERSWQRPKLTLRTQRLGLLDWSRGHEERLEVIRPAFSLPAMGRLEAGDSELRGAGWIHGRKDVIATLRLQTSPVGETASYQRVRAYPDLTLAELIAVYLRRYWEVVGEPFWLQGTAAGVEGSLAASVKVVELHTNSGAGSERLARFVLLPDGEIHIIGLKSGGCDTALEFATRGIVGPGKRVVKTDAGLLFLEHLPRNFLGKHIAATAVFEMPLADALRSCAPEPVVDKAEGPKVVTLEQTGGPLLVSADIHGNWDDFARLRELFLDAEARGKRPVWVSVGDWVHGPSPALAPIRAQNGESLYDYPDRSAEILRALFALMDSHPGRVISLVGNHEHAHIGGPRTSKFHEDEAAFLESQLTPAEVHDLRTRFRSWPLCVRVPSCGIIITHGAMSSNFANAQDLERIRYGSPQGALADVLASTMTHYGFTDGNDHELLRRFHDPGRPRYGIIVHGHDREERGYGRTGERALLLCSSFGAVRARKAYLWLNLARIYGTLDDLREGQEIRFLWA